MPTTRYRGPPMTLANMRAQGAHSAKTGAAQMTKTRPWGMQAVLGGELFAAWPLPKPPTFVPRKPRAPAPKPHAPAIPRPPRQRNKYLPGQKAGARAAAALAANPRRSDRAIAAELSISVPTVSAARKAGGYGKPPQAPREQKSATPKQPAARVATAKKRHKSPQAPSARRARLMELFGRTYR